MVSRQTPAASGRANGIAEGRWSTTARYTFDIAYDKVIKVAVVAHPSLLKIPEDLEVGVLL